MDAKIDVKLTIMKPILATWLSENFIITSTLQIVKRSHAMAG